MAIENQLETAASDETLEPALKCNEQKTEKAEKLGDKDGEEHLSMFAAIVNFLKASIGTGILALPCAFKYAGIWTGFGSSVILIIISLYTMQTLSRSADKLTNRLNIKDLDYANVATESFRFGPPFCEKIATKIGYLVNSMLIFSQVTCLAIYQVFVAENIKKVVDVTTNYIIPIQLYELMLLVILLPYSQIKGLKVIAVFNAIAALVTFLGIFSVLYVCFTDLPPLQQRPAFKSWSTYPYYIGIAMFVFEGIGTMLPLRGKMTKVGEMTQLIGVINICTIVVAVLSLLVAFFGYWKFGEDVQESITLNMPLNGLFNAVRIMFAGGVFLTIDIQLFVAVLIIWTSAKKRTEAGSFLNKYGENVLKIALILFTFLMAALIPPLDLLISLIGSFASAMLIFVFPCAIDVMHCYDGYRQTADYAPLLNDENRSLLNGDSTGGCKTKCFCYARVTLDSVLIIFGMVVAVVGTTVTVIQIVVTFKQDMLGDL